MKKVYFLFILFTNILFANSFYTINNSKLVNGNILVFKEHGSNDILNVPIKDNRLIFEKKFRDGGEIYDILKRNISAKAYTIAQVYNVMASTRDIASIDGRKATVIYQDRLYFGVFKVERKDDLETIFDDMSTIYKISFYVDKIFNFQRLKIENSNHKPLFSLSKDEKNNICSFSTPSGYMYSLKSVENKHLKEFISIRKKLIENFDFSRLPIIVKYIKNTKNGVTTKEVTYEQKSKKGQTAIIVTTKTKEEDGEKHISYAQLYIVENGQTLFQLKGYNKIGSNKIYSFIQYPSQPIVKVYSRGTASNYFRKGIYYYNKAGLWYLLNWLKQKDIKDKNAYIFYGTDNAIEIHIGKSENGYNINKKISIKFLTNSPVIREFGDFKFIDIENDVLKNIKDKYKIKEIYR